jgi:hypothetical protein
MRYLKSRLARLFSPAHSHASSPRRLTPKLLALLAPLALVVGLAAPSMAFAGVASESLPSTVKSNWTGVETECNGKPTPVTGCEFVATSTASVLTNLESPFATCEVVLKGKIFANGSSEITAGEIKTQTTLCKRIHINTEKEHWVDQICEYTGSSPHSYYDRLSINFFEAASEKIADPIYIHLLNASKADESPLTVRFGSVRKFANALKPGEIGKGPWGILADGESGSMMYEFTKEPVIKVTSTTGSCPWNFEKLNELP